MFGLQGLRVKVLKEGKEEEKGVYEVFVGDKIVLRTGDMVPLDCRLVEGRVVVDESMLTGKACPFLRRRGTFCFREA